MNKKKGFTLIELLVVIAVIAVLMGILMPSLQKAREQAKGVICQSRLREWGLVWSMYVNENRGKFPDMSGHTWMHGLREYYKENEDLLFCPMTSRNKLIEEGASIRYAVISDNGEPVASYALNEWVYNSDDTGGGRSLDDYWRHAQHRNMDNIPVMGDGAWRSDGQPNHTDAPPEYEGQPRTGVNSDEIRVFTIPRHGHAINVLFMDWSTRRVGLKGLWRLKWNQGFDINYPSPRWPDWMAGFSEK
jgi:prepilin-type N-terminal cleavage/methylation domain-containing protein/prepilin-type processing-associated H-X9-DG protein